MRIKLILLTVGLNLVGVASHARVIPSLSLPTSKFISFYEGLSKSRPLTEKEKEILLMLKFGRDSLDLKTLKPAKATTPELSIQGMDGNEIAIAISKAIESIQKWSPIQHPKINLREDAATRDVLYKYLGSFPFEKAWLEYQQGNKENAIKILSGIFDESFKYIMAEDSHLLMPDQDRPLIKEEHILDVLQSLTSKKDQVMREQQLNEMREHLKKIPINKALA